MSGGMTKSEFVLYIVYATNESACFQPVAQFVSTAETRAAEEYPRPLLFIPIETYDDMGEPQTITVTVEPGDRLNG